jgi:hypothetical protein
MTGLFEALGRFMHAPWTPWWNRIWIIQEVAMPNRIVVAYETITVPWSMFGRAATNFSKYSSSCCHNEFQSIPRDQLKVLDDFSRKVLDIERLRTDYTEDPINFPGSGQANTLLPLLRKFRNRKASDPRDKVYALLSMVKNSYRRVIPDYTLSMQDVFQRATLEAIYASGSLSVSCCDFGRKHDYVCSTCPHGFQTGTRLAIRLIAILGQIQWNCTRVIPGS